MNDKPITHIDRLNSLSKLEAEGFEGMDASMAESVFHYNYIWKYEQDKLIVIHNTSQSEKKFERSTFELDFDIYKEYDWADFQAIYDFTGMTKEDWDKMPLHSRLYDLKSYYGVEEIFGTTYWEGSEISED